MSDTPETDALLDRVDAAMKLIEITRRERNRYKEDLVEIVDTILKRNGLGVFDMSAIDRLAELHAAERERDEWYQKCHANAVLVLDDREERDQWRECAERFARAIETIWSGEPSVAIKAEALAEFDRLKEASK